MCLAHRTTDVRTVRSADSRLDLPRTLFVPMYSNSIKDYHRRNRMRKEIMKSQTRRAGWHLALATALIGLTVPAFAQTGAWAPTTNPMNANRDSHTVLNLNGSIYVF